MAHVLTLEIQQLAKAFGVENLGFLTLTFADHVTELAEAQKRFRSLNTNIISKRYRRAIGVWERQRSGRIHFHLVVVCHQNIREGFDFGQAERGIYRSANLALRQEWAFWRKTAPAYRFGRTELLPVKSTADGIARYVGKYVSKHVSARKSEDKGARVVRFIGYKSGQRTASARFSWAEGNGFLWRQKLKAYAARIGAQTTEDLASLFGPRWAYLLQQEILAEPIPSAVCFPSWELAQRSLEATPYEVAKLRAQQIKESKQCQRTYVIKPPSTFPSVVGAAILTVKETTSTRGSSPVMRRGNGVGFIACGSSIATRIKFLLAKQAQAAFKESALTFPREIDCPF